VFIWVPFRHNLSEEARRKQVLNDLQHSIDVRQLVVFRADHCQKAGYSMK